MCSLNRRTTLKFYKRDSIFSKTKILKREDLQSESSCIQQNISFYTAVSEMGKSEELLCMPMSAHLTYYHVKG